MLRGGVWLVAMAIGLGIACGSGAPEPSVERAAPPAPAIVLSATPPAVVSLAPHTRPHRLEPAEEIALSGWRRGPSGWRTALPVTMLHATVSLKPPGMHVVGADGVPLPFAPRGRGRGPRWWWQPGVLHVDGLQEAPADGALRLRAPSAAARERRRHPALTGHPTDAPLHAEALVDGVRHEGLLLPAPSQMAWDLALSGQTHLSMQLGLVRPDFADGPASDGATLSVTWTVGDRSTTPWSGAVPVDAMRPVEVVLPDGVGGAGRLTLSTAPGGDNRFDHVLVSQAVLREDRGAGRVMVLVFVDTLRADRLGAYGHDRPTSPHLDALAARGLRFDQARSVAPWTLPSTRSMFSGRQPEAFSSGPTLAEVLQGAGWATAGFASNVYLAPGFGVSRGFGEYRVRRDEPAPQLVDRALAFLDAHPTRDRFVMVHLMETHLPWNEPGDLRQRLAGAPPVPGLDRPGLGKRDIERVDTRSDAVRAYLSGRYDATIAQVDRALGRLFEALPPEAHVVVVSDHGEELWDHGGFEHGHSLYDELLRVPLVLAGPGVPEGAVRAAPVSLVDVAPTMAALAGVDLAPVDGLDLLATDDAVLAARPQGFGRMLYGPPQWGALAWPRKVVSVPGELGSGIGTWRDAGFDLAVDPGERRPTDGGGHLPVALSEALGREVVWAHAFTPAEDQDAGEDLVVEVTMPGGLRTAFVGIDPKESSTARVARVDDDTWRLTWPAPRTGARRVWVVPVAEGSKPLWSPQDAPLVGHEGWTPILTAEDDGNLSYDPETSAMLEMLGYVVGGEGHDDP